MVALTKARKGGAHHAGSKDYCRNPKIPGIARLACLRRPLDRGTYFFDQLRRRQGAGDVNPVFVRKHPMPSESVAIVGTQFWKNRAMNPMHREESIPPAGKRSPWRGSGLPRPVDGAGDRTAVFSTKDPMPSGAIAAKLTFVAGPGSRAARRAQIAGALQRESQSGRFSTIYPMPSGNDDQVHVALGVAPSGAIAYPGRNMTGRTKPAIPGARA